MKTDKRLYVVSSQPAAAGRAVGGSRSHLRLVRAGVAGDELAPLVRSGVRRRRSASGSEAPLARRSLSRPFGQRMMQAASDIAVLAVALIVGLRPSA